MITTGLKATQSSQIEQKETCCLSSSSFTSTNNFGVLFDDLVATHIGSYLKRRLLVDGVYKVSRL